MRRAVKGWGIILAVLLAAVLATALAGGFQRAGDSAADTESGTWVELTRWDVRVDGCVTVIADDGAPPEVLLRLMLVNRWDRSLGSMNDASWQVRIPNGDVFGAEGEYIHTRDAERDGWFDPGVERPAVARMTLTQPWTGGEPILVRFAEERLVDGFVLADNWVSGRIAAEVEVECPVGADQ